MSYILHRIETGSKEFFIIRRHWLNVVDDIPFGEWLQQCGVDEEHVGDHIIDDETYVVMKIIFKSEQEYLIFKLKYLC